MFEMASISDTRHRLRKGLVIPACPLALTESHRLDERRQRALFRYYIAAGAGGLAVGVHTTQFAIRDPKVGLFRPVLEIAAEESKRRSKGEVVLVGGICGQTRQAVSEAETLRELGYDAGLVSLGALRTATEDELVMHCRELGRVIPLFGFYLQPAVGGRHLPVTFWRRLAELPELVAVKIAPFNRYQTIDVIRAVTETGRDDIAFYTGNDDHIVLDLLTPFCFVRNGKTVRRHIVGGLLGHWAIWTRKAVALHARCRKLVASGLPVPLRMMALANAVTDANAAIFDAANGYAGCIPGIHEVLRRQGLMAGNWCLNPNETLSAGQAAEIDRVTSAYPMLRDDDFVEAHLDEWLK